MKFLSNFYRSPLQKVNQGSVSYDLLIRVIAWINVTSFSSISYYSNLSFISVYSKSEVYFYWENFTHSIKCFRVLRPKHLIVNKRRTTSYRHANGCCSHFHYINIEHRIWSTYKLVQLVKDAKCRISPKDPSVNNYLAI